MHNLINVALDVPINKLYDYACNTPGIKIGCRVKVQFGKSLRIGIVIGFNKNKGLTDKYQIKEIIEVIDKEPLLTKEIIKTCKWASAYYHHPIGQVVFTAITPIHRKGKSEPKKNMEIQNCIPEKKLKLNKEQNNIVENIFRDINTYKVNVIRGVTGSGKTEVYAKIVQKLFEHDAQVLIMVPEINLIPQTISRFKKYLDIEPIEYHSNLTPAQKCRVWKLCKNKKKLLIIGTRSSVFLPFINLKLLGVDEEHDYSYKQNEMFRYNARDIGILRSKNFNCPVILGSATPSFETIHNIVTHKYKQYEMKNRYFKSKLPLISIVDTSIDKPDEGISKTLKDNMKKELNNNKKVILFIGRRGFSNTVICSECKSIIKCPKCDVYMTYHKSIERLICHQCEFKQSFKEIKECCQNPTLVTLGVGTQRLENKIKKIFPNKRVMRVDSDNISSKKDLNDFIIKANNDEIDIFIGTQMIVKGHDFNNVSLVGIINIDAGLYSTDFRGLEKTAQLITQVAGRSGRQEEQGQVIVQTNNPKHDLLQKILKEGYEKFSKFALKQRELVNLPPYSHIGIIKTSSPNKYISKSILSEIVKFKKNKLVFVYGPSPSGISKKNNEYYYQIIVGSNSPKLLSEHISRIKLYLFGIDKKIKWHIDIDPIEQ